MAMYGEWDKEDPWQRSTPERRTLELPLRGASFDVHSVSEAGAIPTPINSCGESSGCSIGMSISWYSSKFVLSKILTSSRSSLMMGMLRFVTSNAHYSMLLWVTEISQSWALPGPRLPVKKRWKCIRITPISNDRKGIIDTGKQFFSDHITHTHLPIQTYSSPNLSLKYIQVA